MKFLNFLFLCIFLCNIFPLFADDADFRIIVTRNDQSIGGQLHADLELQITAGEDTSTLHSLTADIVYNSALTAWSADPVVDWGVWETDSAYFRDAAKLTDKYRVMITQGDTCGVNHKENVSAPGDPEGWDARTVWKKIVTLRWEIAALTAPTLTIDDGTNDAAYFDNYQNIPYGSTATNWDVSNEDLSNPVLVKAKVFLEGPYNTTNDNMDTDLNASITNDAPYTEDQRNAASIPATAVDWVQVHLRSAADGSNLATRTAFINQSGEIMETNGVSGVSLDITNDDYFIIIDHRNHLAVMSDEVWSLSSTSSTEYDFTIDESVAYDKYYGGDAALLETGVYGMYAGDGNESGIVTISDANLAITNRDAVGYNISDYNLSGIVTISDANLAIFNRDASTNVP